MEWIELRRDPCIPWPLCQCVYSVCSILGMGCTQHRQALCGYDFLDRKLTHINYNRAMLVFSFQGYQVTSAQQMLAQGLKNRANDLSVDLKVAAVKGKYLQDNYQDLFYTKARNLVWKLRRAFDEALTKVDVLIMPTTPMKARRIPHINVTLKGNLKQTV